MKKIFSVFKTIRRNWKKSTFGILVLSYGANYANVSYNNRELMKEYCLAASKFGDVPVTENEFPTRVAVILNPAANRKRSIGEYEKYCAPIMHLAGLQVTVFLTNGVTGARKILNSLPENTDAILIAGGDGTVSEVLTGLLRRANENFSLSRKMPIGILPLGEKNSLAKKLYGSKRYINDTKYSQASARVRLLAEAAYTASKHDIQFVDVMKIDNLQDDQVYKPIYAASSIDWGVFRNAEYIKNKYWYFGNLRSYVPYILGSKELKKPLVKAVVKYTGPCSGCKECYKSRPDLIEESAQNHSISNKRWWQIWISQKKPDIGIDYTKIENPLCAKFEEKTIEAVNLTVKLSFLNSEPASLATTIGPLKLSYLDFVKEGWRRVNEKPTELKNENFQAQQIHIDPIFEDNKQNEDAYLSIDSEEFLVRKMKIVLLRKAVAVFCPPVA